MGDKIGSRKVVVENIGRDDDIAVDWIYNNVYWTSVEKRVISVTNIDGDHIVDVIKEDLEHPKGVAVHPKKGQMFWADWRNKNSRIEKAGMDGTNRLILIKDNVVWPSGISLDLVMERVYWVDAKLHIIGSVAIDGTLPNILKVSIKEKL